MITPEFEKILRGESLNTYQAQTVMNFLISDISNDALRASFLASMLVNGVSADELLGFARALREHASVKRIAGLTDVVGTGGDRMNTVNVTTAAAIVSASLGIKIGKHGNYASTGIHGSADFLKKTGYVFSMTENGLISRINTLNFVFILANYYNEHFMKFSAVRRKLGFTSVLNYLGPITNPLDPDTMIIGCTSKETAKMYADVIDRAGKTGCVITAEDGMDEVSPLSPTTFYMVHGDIDEYTVYPSELDLDGISLEDISSKNPDQIFSRTMAGLRGEDLNVSKFIAANAAPVLLVHRKGQTLSQCYGIALEAITDGRALKKLNEIGGKN